MIQQVTSSLSVFIQLLYTCFISIRLLRGFGVTYSLRLSFTALQSGEMSWKRVRKITVKTGYCENELAWFCLPLNIGATDCVTWEVSVFVASGVNYARQNRRRLLKFPAVVAELSLEL